MKTAIQKLIEDITKHDTGKAVVASLRKEFEKAIEREKSQITSAFNKGVDDAIGGAGCNTYSLEGKEYFKQKYRKS